MAYMIKSIRYKNTVLTLVDSTFRLHLARAFLFVAIAFACFTFLPTLRAVTPAPDGGYANGNTAEGDSALFSLTSGIDNTAIGAGALYSNTEGTYNTAIGF